MTVHRLSEGEPSDWVSPEYLLAQYRESVARNAADSTTQRAWMHTWNVHVPSDEIRQDLDDVVFTHQPRLMRAGLLSAGAVAAVGAILAEYDSWTDMTLWRSEDAMDRPEWASVRATAKRALDVINRV